MFGSTLDGLEESGSCLVEPANGLIIADGNGEGVELREGDPGFEELLGFG